MKRLIDANELTNSPVAKTFGIRTIDVDNAPTVLTIPNNPTNGDMIKAMFPNIHIEEGSKYVLLESEYDNVAIWNSWWNAPYKKGGKDA